MSLKELYNNYIEENNQPVSYDTWKAIIDNYNKYSNSVKSNEDFFTPYKKLDIDMSTEDLPGETWKEIPLYDNRYMISNKGRIKTTKYGRSGNRTKIISMCIGSSGYPTVKVWDGEKNRTKSLHQLVALTYLGECPEGYQVNHIDGDKMNNDPSNLEYVTRQDNIRHSFAELDRDISSKLSEEDVINIRKAAKERTLTVKEIVKKFNISVGTYYNIKNKVTWKNT